MVSFFYLIEKGVLRLWRKGRRNEYRNLERWLNDRKVSLDLLEWELHIILVLAECLFSALKHHFKVKVALFTGLPGVASGKEPACQCRRHKRRGFDSWLGKIPWRRAFQPTPVFMPGESYGQRSHRVAKSQTRLKRLSRHTQLYWQHWVITLSHRWSLTWSRSLNINWSGSDYQSVTRRPPWLSGSGMGQVDTL